MPANNKLPLVYGVSSGRRFEGGYSETSLRIFSDARRFAFSPWPNMPLYLPMKRVMRASVERFQTSRARGAIGSSGRRAASPSKLQ